MTDVPTKKEVKVAVDKLKSNKAPGPDGIPSEILKEGYIYIYISSSSSVICHTTGPQPLPKRLFLERDSAGKVIMW
jgi:hypothetical protein